MAVASGGTEAAPTGVAGATGRASRVHAGRAGRSGSRATTGQPGEPAVADRRGSDLAADSADTATLVEALDDLPRPGWVGRDGARIGDEALRAAARPR